MARTPSVRGAREARTPGDLVPPGHERHTTFSPHPTPGLKKPKNVSTTDEIRLEITGLTTHRALARGSGTGTAVKVLSEINTFI